MSFQEPLKRAIAEVERAFDTDELAYLALTQKVEHAFRDKLAFRLHKMFEQTRPGLLVCREWQRADLAIVDGKSPLLILEAKAGYTFDIMRGDKGYDFPTLVAGDLRKAAALAIARTSNPEIYALVIATHPHSAPAAECRHAIKYHRDVKKYATDANNLEAVRQIMDVRMSAFELVHATAVKAGQAFGTAVSVHVWLYRSKEPGLRVASAPAAV